MRSLIDDRINHETTFWTRVEWTIFSLLLGQRQLRWIAENNVDTLPVRQRDHGRPNRKVDHAFPNPIALGVLNRQSNCVVVGVEQIDAFGALKLRNDGKETGAASHVDYGLIAQVGDVLGKQQGVWRYWPDILAKSQ